MAKGSNMSKCRGMESVCNDVTRFESIVKVGRSMTNSGFVIEFDVDCTGFRPEKDQVYCLSEFLYRCLKKGLDRIVSELTLKNFQKEFDF